MLLGNYHYESGLSSLRLKTRWLRPDDENEWQYFFEDPEATAFLPDFGISDNPGKARHMINYQLKRYAENRFGLQAVLNAESGELVGLCGLLLQQLNGKTELEISYHLLKKHWGKGFASEAAMLFKKFACDHLLHSSVVSIIDIGNERSKKVAIRNGLVLHESSRMDGEDVLVYRHFIKS